MSLKNPKSGGKWNRKKIPYENELQRRIQNLQLEATSLSTQLMLIENDTAGLIAENNELKLYLQSIKQQIQFQDATNDALMEEINWLGIETSQMSSNGRAMTNVGEPSYEELQQFYHHNHAMQPLLAAQQRPILRQHQLTQQGHRPQLQHALHLKQQQQALGGLRTKGPQISQELMAKFNHILPLPNVSSKLSLITQLIISGLIF